MKMPVPRGRDKVLSSAMSWSLPKCLSAHVSLLLKIMLWLPSVPSINGAAHPGPCALPRAGSSLPLSSSPSPPPSSL